MGYWSGKSVGLRVKPKEKKLAEQFLICLGVDTDGYGIDQIGPLSYSFRPSVNGVLNSDLLGIASILDQHYSDYVDQFYYSSDEEGCEDTDDFEDEDDFEVEDDPEDEDDFEDEDIENALDDDDVFDFQPDDLFQLTNKLFPSAYVYLAHEEGNNTSDDYYRYEVIFDPTSNKKTELNCFYSYGEGINVSSDDDPKEDATEKSERTIANREIKPNVIDWLINQAENKGFSELVALLNACK